MAKWLRVTGIVCCIGVTVAHFVLLDHYERQRPVIPRPEQGMTVALSWTHPVRYGTQQDASRSQWLFELFLPSFGLIAVGEFIRIYKLDDYSGIRSRLKVPWNHKWGP